MNAPSLQTFIVEVPPNGRTAIDRQARIVFCKEATHPFEISIDREGATEMEAGIGYPAAADAQDYKYFEITNPENVPLRVKLQFGSGGIIDTRAIFAGIVNVQNKVPDVVNSDFPVFCPDAATTQIAAQNTRRAHIQIVNLGNDTVFLGNSPTATFNYGTPLFANGVATWPTTAALYIRNDTGAPVNISVTELEITP